MFYLSLSKLQIINYEAVKKCKVSWSSRQVYRCKFYPNRLQAAYVVFKTFNLLWLSVTLSLFTFYFLNFQSLQFIFKQKSLILGLSRPLWIPGIFGISVTFKETWILVSRIQELKESFKMIRNSNQFRGSSTMKIHFLTFAWAFRWVDIPLQTFNMDQKMRKKISHLLIPTSKGSDRGKMVLNKKLVKNRTLRGFKLRGMI